MEWTEKKKNEWGLSGEIEASRHKTRAERLTFVYIIYQALIFSYVSGGLPTGAGEGAGHRWIPLAFSVSLSVVYFSGFIDAVAAFNWAQYDVDVTGLELGLGRAHVCLTANQISYLLEVGPKTPEEVRYRVLKRRVVSGVVVVLLVGFAVVMGLACWLVSPPAAVGGGSVFGSTK